MAHTCATPTAKSEHPVAKPTTARGERRGQPPLQSVYTAPLWPATHCLENANLEMCGIHTRSHGLHKCIATHNTDVRARITISSSSQSLEVALPHCVALLAHVQFEHLCSRLLVGQWNVNAFFKSPPNGRVEVPGCKSTRYIRQKNGWRWQWGADCTHQGRLVAASTSTPSWSSISDIRTRNSVLIRRSASFSSDDLWPAMASISSMKITAGLFCVAW